MFRTIMSSRPSILKIWKDNQMLSWNLNKSVYRFSGTSSYEIPRDVCWVGELRSSPVVFCPPPASCEHTIQSERWLHSKCCPEHSVALTLAPFLRNPPNLLHTALVHAGERPAEAEVPECSRNHRTTVRAVETYLGFGVPKRLRKAHSCFDFQ